MLHRQKVVQKLDRDAIREKRSPADFLAEQFWGAPFRLTPVVQHRIQIGGGSVLADQRSRGRPNMPDVEVPLDGRPSHRDGQAETVQIAATLSTGDFRLAAS